MARHGEAARIPGRRGQNEAHECQRRPQNGGGVVRERAEKILLDAALQAGTGGEIY